MVQFNNVSKIHHNGIAAILDVSFVIDEGEFVFLIGPSGSGKTTIIELLIRDQHPTEGKIFLNDVDITKISRSKVYILRRQIGVIFQDFKLIEEKNAFENVAFAMEAAGKSSKEIKETVPYVLDIVGLGDRMQSFPVQLSGGEQQRVAIARAIANNPKILIADEPTGNLDPASAWDIVQILTKINNWGTTVIMSTHGTDIVNTLNKRVIQMDKGKIVRDDNEGGYEFFKKPDEKKIAKLKKKTKKTKSSFKVKLGKDGQMKNQEVTSTEDEEDSLMDTDVEDEEKSEDTALLTNKGMKRRRGLFGRIFRGKQKEEILVEDSVCLPEDEELDLNEEVEVDIEEDEKVPERTTKKKNMHTSLGKHTGLAKEIDQDEDTDSGKKSTKGTKGKRSSKKKRGKSDTVKDEKTELDDLVQKFEKRPIEFLNLPGKVIKDLKSAGYEKIGQIIEDGPEKLADNLIIDPEEVVLVAKALEKLTTGR